MTTLAPPAPTERALLGAHLRAVAAELDRLDPLVRAGAADAVHRMRVQARTLRSTLRIFRRSFDPAGTELVRTELAWLGEVLGGPRDLEVLAGHLDAVLATLPPELVRAGTGPWISDRLHAEQAEARRAALAAMASDRYAALRLSWSRLADQPPWGPGGDRAATRRLPKALVRSRRALDRSVAAAARSEESERPRRLHAVRRRAKRTRYAAEVLEPVLGKQARRTAREAERVQTVLGEFHDAVVAAEHTRRLAALAAAESRDTFTFGVLHAALADEARQHESAFARVWSRRRDVRLP